MRGNLASAHRGAGLAFDSIAESYDDLFTRSLIGRAQRTAVWKVARHTFRRGDFVLELNCGTGEDAFFLARQGVSVFASDASQKMIQVATRRCEVEAAELPVWFETLPIERIAELVSVGPFDGVFSNFSGLNCVSDLREVALTLSRMVRPGGQLLLCLSSRFCLWEMLWFLAQGDVKRAVRRWNGRATAALGGNEVDVRYPTLREIRRRFSSWFALRSWMGIGVAVPPSYVEHVARKHVGVLRDLQALDETIAAWPGLRSLGDHVLLRFERLPS